MRVLARLIRPPGDRDRRAFLRQLWREYGPPQALPRPAERPLCPPSDSLPAPRASRSWEAPPAPAPRHSPPEIPGWEGPDYPRLKKSPALPLESHRLDRQALARRSSMP